MAAHANLTGTAQFSTVHAREVDFVTRFNDNWEALRAIMGIMRPIRKASGTQLVSYVAEMDGTLQGGTVAEGEEIPRTKFKVVERTKRDVSVKKYAKEVSIEAVSKYGADIAIEKTDDQFLVELQNVALTQFYTFLNTGVLKGTQTTWQKALAIAKGAVLNKFADMNKTVTDVVGFANVMDLYSYIGAADITVQTAFGLQYVKDFMGYSTLFLLPEKFIKSGRVIACPVENIDMYYIDPADSDFAKLGLQYTAQGETNLIGFHVEGDYNRATGNSFALMGIELWAEYLDAIAVVDVDTTDVTPVVAEGDKPVDNGDVVEPSGEVG